MITTEITTSILRQKKSENTFHSSSICTSKGANNTNQIISEEKKLRNEAKNILKIIVNYFFTQKAAVIPSFKSEANSLSQLGDLVGAYPDDECPNSKLKRRRKLSEVLNKRGLSSADFVVFASDQCTGIDWFETCSDKKHSKIVLEKPKISVAFNALKLLTDSPKTLESTVSNNVTVIDCFYLGTNQKLLHSLKAIFREIYKCDREWNDYKSMTL